MKKEFNFREHGIILVLLLTLSILTACGAQADQASAANENTPIKPKPELNEYDAEIRAFRVADFDYIFTFKRKDGKPMSADDKRFVKNNSHFNTNRFTLNSDETVVFAGSNYKFPDAGISALKNRFVVENFSKPEDFLEKRRAEFTKKAEEEKKKREKQKKKNAGGDRNK
jgi:hypothetical protein